MARFKEFRERGLKAYRAGAWKEARYALLRSAEHLLRLAQLSEGELRTQRLDNARRLKERALAIDPAAPPRRLEAAETAKPRGDGDAEGSRFQEVERPGVRFADIAGLEDVKEQVRLKLIYPLRHREEAQRYGIRLGGGVLLYGPPGTGKTLMARAIAGEIEAAFFTVKPSEIMSRWVGDSERNIAELFATARRQPVSVIFIDEIEALVPARREGQPSVMQRVVPQILGELEGFDTAEQNPVLFLGATNEPWSLDPAVLRPGRFDEKIYVGLPDLPARVRLLELFTRSRPVADDVVIPTLAERLEGFSGADVRALCDKAASEAFRAAVERGEEALIDQARIDRLLGEMRPSVGRRDLERYRAFADA